MKIKVYEDFKKFEKKHPILVKTGVVAATVVLIVALTSTPVVPKEENITIPTATSAPAKVPAPPVQQVPEEDYYGYDLKVKVGTKVRLEPSQNGAYIETITNNEYANLIAIDGDYALISHQNSNDTYSRIGYVPLESTTIPFKERFHSRVDSCLEYVYFTEDNVRIRNDMNADHSARNILVNAKRGDFARVIGVVPNPEWSDEKWYLVAYKGYIGYMKNENGNFISAEQMQEIIEQENQFIRITGVGINFRREAVKNQNNVITHLNKGDTVKIIGETPEWYYVSYNGIEGYISKTLTCIEKYSAKSIPKGISCLHFDSDITKTR